MKLEDLSRTEQYFLLRLEKIVVDNHCSFDLMHLTRNELHIFKKFKNLGLLDCGKPLLKGYSNYRYERWLILSDEALDFAHQLRKKLAKNLYSLLAYNHVKDQKQHLTVQFEGL